MYSEGEHVYRLLKAEIRRKRFLSILTFVFGSVLVYVPLAVVMSAAHGNGTILIVPSPSSDLFIGYLAITFGLVAIAVAIYFGVSDKVRDFLLKTKKGEVDQKIAMLYQYAMSVGKWRDEHHTVIVDMNLMMGRIVADIWTIGRIRKSVRDEQRDSLLLARNQLIREMRTNDFNNEVDRIETLFRSFYLW